MAIQRMRDNRFEADNRVALPTGVLVLKNDQAKAATAPVKESLNDTGIGKSTGRKPVTTVGGNSLTPSLS